MNQEMSTLQAPFPYTSTLERRTYLKLHNDAASQSNLKYKARKEEYSKLIRQGLILVVYEE